MASANYEDALWTVTREACADAVFLLLMAAFLRKPVPVAVEPEEEAPEGAGPGDELPVGIPRGA
jgi:hypothetical protein